MKSRSFTGGLYVSDPWEAQTTRRGDPLGFQGIANDIAANLAPGISGRHQDIRWLTLLCKGLSIIQNDQSITEKYSRLSLWERGILCYCINNNDDKGKGIHLPGKLKAPHDWPDRYRFQGPFGAYKSLLTNIGLTEQDGYQMTESGLKLSRVIKEAIPRNKKNIIDFAPFEKFAPKHWSDTTLFDIEKVILKPALFGNDEHSKRRRHTANTMAMAESELDFWHKWDDKKGPIYYWFDQFTKYCFSILRFLHDNIDVNGSKIDDLPQNTSLTHKLKNLIDDSTTYDLSNMPNVVILITHLKKNSDDLGRAILEHHINLNTTQLCWFGKRNNKVYCLNENGKIRSRYRYRRQQLWRLANQLLDTQGIENEFWMPENIKSEMI
jgi:hypothetical protein